MGFFSRLFSSNDTVSKATDAVISAGDALFFTDEEKSRANQKKLDWVLEYHKASKGSNLARRFLAVMFVGVFLFLILVCAALILLKQPELFKQMYELIKDTLIQPISIIIGFYFLSGMVNTWSGTKK